MADSGPDITAVLSAAAAGDPAAARDLLPLVYRELRRLAQARMLKTPPGNTLQPTALVHEAYLRLVGSGDPGWNSRGHFFGAAAQAMRNILVEQARRKAAIKHGGEHARIAADPEGDAVEFAAPDDVLALEEALQKLEEQDPSSARVVVLKHFAGLSEAEIAAALDASPRTVRREWRFARAWLHREMGGETALEEDGDAL